MSAVSWTGAGGDNNWNDALNWNTGKLPGPADDVTITISADVVHSDAVTDSINSLTSTQPLTLSGGTLSIAAASSTSGPLVVDGGSLTGTGDITVNGLLTLTAGTISGSGVLSANGGILINPTGTAFALDGRTLTNAAGQTATWTGTGSNIQASGGAVFNNLGTFVAQNQGAFSQGTGAASSFVDKGSFTKSTSSGELDFTGVAFNVTGGTVDVQTGTLGLQGGGTETGASFSIETAATLDFAGSSAFSLDTGTTFSGAGNLTKDGPTTLTLPGNSASLTGPTTLNSGTLLVNGSQPGSAVSVETGSTLGGTGTVGAVATTGGTVSPGDGTGILNVDGNVTLDPSSTFTVELNGPAPGTGYDQLNVTGTVNLAGSTLSPSAGFKPSGESFTIIRSTGPIVGTFKGLSEGALVLINNLPFKISYAGGNGDDVVLTVVGPVMPPQILSNDSTTFTVGMPGAFTVSAIGAPLPAMSETGALPSGVLFVNNGDGNPVIAGTPKAGAGGTYHLKITASNGQVPSATQNFTLTVNEAPAITSAAAMPFVVGIANSFTVTTTGFPTSTLSGTGALPSGLTFVDQRDGTATLAGMPAAGTGGTYDLKITAANGVGGGVSQNFRLTVNPAPQSPMITSAASTTFMAGQTGTFLVTATGSPTAVISATGALPPGVTLVNNGDGTATLTAAPAANLAGTFQLSIMAANGVGTAATQDFTFHVVIATPPKVLRLQRLRGRTPTRIVLSFDQPMNAALAQLTSNYVFRRVVRGRALLGPRHAIRVKSAVYDPAKQTVTLTTARRLSLKLVYQISVNGGTPRGLTNVSGVPLDGNGNGLPGSSFIMSFTGRASL
ncbi:MAG: beta strand repeat-containing protein [Isosphaerales bacterium]